MARLRPILLFPLAAGCFVGGLDAAGHPCQTDADCGSTELVCTDEICTAVGEASESTSASASATVGTSVGESSSSSGTVDASGDSSESGGMVSVSATTEGSTTAPAESTSGGSDTQAEPLAIDAIDPPLGSNNLAHAITITGSGFADGVEVTFGSVVATVDEVAPNQLQVTVPPSIATTGPVDVSVALDADDAVLPGGYTFVGFIPTFEALDPVIVAEGVNVGAGGLVLGDLVGGPELDAVTAAANPGEPLVVLAGDGQGGFVETFAPGFGGTYYVTMVDFDDDGLLDFVTSSSTLHTYRNNGFDAFDVVDTGYAAGRGVAPIDADGDAYPDLLSAWGPGGVAATVLQNDGTGDFSVLAQLPDDGWTQYGNFPAAADVDGNGWQDVVVGSGNPSPAGVLVWLHDGVGTFDGPISTPVVGELVWATRAAKLDAGVDDTVDLVIGGYNVAAHRLLGAGDGTFDPTPIQGTVGPMWMVVDDYNADGNVDVAWSNADQSIEVQRGDPGGTFVTAGVTNLPGTAFIMALATGDFDDDGLPDLVAFQRDGLTLTLQPLRNTSAG